MKVEREEDEEEGQKGQKERQRQATSADTQAHVSCLLYSVLKSTGDSGELQPSPFRMISDESPDLSGSQFPHL